MRSRFTAFVVARPDHLLATWHPVTRPTSIDIDPETHWRRLQIVDEVAGGIADDSGVVEFRASFREHGAAGLLHERSRFERVGGRWFYLDGEQL